jgi:hypothetical protein
MFRCSATLVSGHFSASRLSRCVPSLDEIAAVLGRQFDLSAAW